MQSSQPQIRLEDFIRRIPFANLLLFINSFTLWILDLPGLTSTYLVNNSQSWSPEYQLWRIFTSSFCITQIFTLLLIFFNFYTFLPKLEFKTSSLYILLNFFVIGAIIQLLYTICISVLSESMRKYVSNGDMFGIWFNFIVKYCYFNTKSKIKLCCFPVHLRKILYPFVLLAVLMALSFTVRLDAIIGIALAFIQCKFLKAEMIPIKSDLCCSFLSKFSLWVPAGSQISTPFYGLQQSVVSLTRGSQSTKDGDMDYFKSKKGIRLSDG